jgi:hypothetical protein
MKAVRKKRGWVYRGAFISTCTLAVVTGGLWLASYGMECYLQIEVLHDLGLGFFIRNGLIDLCYQRDPIFVGNVFWIEFYEWEFLTGNLWELHWGEFSREYNIRMPAWIPSVVLFIWPTIVAIRTLCKSPLAGLCPACGYDLRGSVGSVSCPECGAGILGVGKKASKSKSREAASG